MLAVRALALLLVLPLATMPAGGAPAPDGCSASTDPSAVSLGGLYYLKVNPSVSPLIASSVTLYYETNDIDGLQLSRTYCGPGEYIEPDTRGPHVTGMNPL